jgi:hypothetical protein
MLYPEERGSLLEAAVQERRAVSDTTMARHVSEEEEIP